MIHRVFYFISPDSIRPGLFRLTDQTTMPLYRTCLSHPSTFADLLLPMDDDIASPLKFDSLPILASPPAKRLRPPETLYFSTMIDPCLSAPPPSLVCLIDSTDFARNFNEHHSMMIFDCGSPFRHNENRIFNAELLRVSDKISRKRLKSNPAKHSTIDVEQLNQVDFILLYDDNTSNHRELSAGLKCACEEVQRCLIDKHRPIYILQDSFEHFFHLYPNLCQSQSNPNTNPIATTPVLSNIDLENYPMTEILHGIFIGSESNARNLEELSSEHIRHIVNVTSHVPLYHSDQFHYHHIPADDTQKQNLLEYFDQAYSFISQAIENNERVLVHCVAGISRSPAIVISFLMRYGHMKMNDAYEFVKTKRSIVSPNLNFMGQLLQYEKKLNEEK